MCQGFEYAKDTEGSEYERLLNNAWTCQNMLEAGPKITAS